ncbi:hypothetical protein HDU82_002079 [Entophlyctis luteolus]|nr:hypothetical protein HDU82_002079 [Entophlyctis luteolus]
MNIVGLLLAAQVAVGAAAQNLGVLADGSLLLLPAANDTRLYVAGAVSTATGAVYVAGDVSGSGFSVFPSPDVHAPSEKPLAFSSGFVLLVPYSLSATNHNSPPSLLSSNDSFEIEFLTATLADNTEAGFVHISDIAAVPGSEDAIIAGTFSGDRLVLPEKSSGERDSATDDAIVVEGNGLSGVTAFVARVLGNKRGFRWGYGVDVFSGATNDTAHSADYADKSPVELRERGILASELTIRLPIKVNFDSDGLLLVAGSFSGSLNLGNGAALQRFVTRLLELVTEKIVVDSSNDVFDGFLLKLSTDTGHLQSYHSGFLPFVTSNETSVVENLFTVTSVQTNPCPIHESSQYLIVGQTYSVDMFGEAGLSGKNVSAHVVGISAEPNDGKTAKYNFVSKVSTRLGVLSGISSDSKSEIFAVNQFGQVAEGFRLFGINTSISGEKGCAFVRNTLITSDESLNRSETMSDTGRMFTSVIAITEELSNAGNFSIEIPLHSYELSASAVSMAISSNNAIYIIGSILDSPLGPELFQGSPVNESGVYNYVTGISPLSLNPNLVGYIPRPALEYEISTDIGINKYSSENILLSFGSLSSKSSEQNSDVGIGAWIGLLDLSKATGYAEGFENSNGQSDWSLAQDETSTNLNSSVQDANIAKGSLILLPATNDTRLVIANVATTPTSAVYVAGDLSGTGFQIYPLPDQYSPPGQPRYASTGFIVLATPTHVDNSSFLGDTTVLWIEFLTATLADNTEAGFVHISDIAAVPGSEDAIIAGTFSGDRLVLPEKSSGERDSATDDAIVVEGNGLSGVTAFVARVLGNKRGFRWGYGVDVFQGRPRKPEQAAADLRESGDESLILNFRLPVKLNFDSDGGVLVGGTYSGTMEVGKNTRLESESGQFDAFMIKLYSETGHLDSFYTGFLDYLTSDKVHGSSRPRSLLTVTSIQRDACHSQSSRYVLVGQTYEIDGFESSGLAGKNSTAHIIEFSAPGENESSKQSFDSKSSASLGVLNEFSSDLKADAADVNQYGQVVEGFRLLAVTGNASGKKTCSFVQSILSNLSNITDDKFDTHFATTLTKSHELLIGTDASKAPSVSFRSSGKAAAEFDVSENGRMSFSGTIENSNGRTSPFVAITELNSFASYAPIRVQQLTELQQPYELAEDVGVKRFGKNDSVLLFGAFVSPNVTATGAWVSLMRISSSNFDAAHPTFAEAAASEDTSMKASEITSDSAGADRTVAATTSGLLTKNSGVIESSIPEIAQSPVDSRVETSESKEEAISPTPISLNEPNDYLEETENLLDMSTLESEIVEEGNILEEEIGESSSTEAADSFFLGTEYYLAHTIKQPYNAMETTLWPHKHPKRTLFLASAVLVITARFSFVLPPVAVPTFSNFGDAGIQKEIHVFDHKTENLVVVENLAYQHASEAEFNSQWVRANINFNKMSNTANPTSAAEPKFLHGIASGDSLANSVILWTKVSPPPNTGSFYVRYDVSLSKDGVAPGEPGQPPAALGPSILSGAVLTGPEVDYVVKIDLKGLAPKTTYYYQFAVPTNLTDYRADSLNPLVKSPAGRTKTLPTENDESITEVQFAVVSCSNLPRGFFTAYSAIAAKDAVDIVLHLGDYLYEYRNGEYGDGSSIGRIPRPDRTLMTLDDYRERHAQYKEDSDLQTLHRVKPWIVIWDDHEFVDDISGVHTAALSNSTMERIPGAMRAYFEYLPIRVTPNYVRQRKNYSAQTFDETPNIIDGFDISGDFPSLGIYRSFHFGTLVDLMMLDTRIAGRDISDWGTVDSASRTILGEHQEQWLIRQLQASSERGASWRIVGNQVVFAQMDYWGLMFNTDAWDGYPANRQRVLDAVDSLKISDVVVVTGDVHAGFAFDVPKSLDSYNPNTGDGSLLVEFVTPAVSSPSPLESIHLGFLNPVAELLFPQLEPHLKFMDLSRRGFLILKVSVERTLWCTLELSQKLKEVPQKFHESLSFHENLAA